MGGEPGGVLVGGDGDADDAGEVGGADEADSVLVGGRGGVGDAGEEGLCRCFVSNECGFTFFLFGREEERKNLRPRGKRETCEKLFVFGPGICVKGDEGSVVWLLGLWSLGSRGWRGRGVHGGVWGSEFRGEGEGGILVVEFVVRFSFEFYRELEMGG